MNLPESSTHSFIIKIWLEETVQEAGRATWRGHITHVPSGKRRYVKELSEIRAFILPYLEKMGIRPTVWSRLQSWFLRSGKSAVKERERS